MAETAVIVARERVTTLQSSGGASVTLHTRPQHVALTTIGVAGPAGPAGTGAGSAAPVSVTTSRALTSADAGRVLQLAHGVSLTIPTGLPTSFACQLLMPAAQVWAGGLLTVSTGGVTLNGSSADWTIERTAGSSLPWMAWLQHETGAEAYSLVTIGATVTAIVGASDVYEAGVYETGIYE